MRSSTSRCLMAEVIMRMVPRRSLSLARIAAFMSSVTRSLREGDDMGWSSKGVGASSKGRQRKAPLRPRQTVGRSVSAGAGAAAVAAVAGDALHVALHGGGLLAFTF